MSFEYGVAGICIRTLLECYPGLFISDTNDLMGHLTCLMPSLSPPLPILLPALSRFSLSAPLPAAPPGPRPPRLEALSLALAHACSRRSLIPRLSAHLCASELKMGWLGPVELSPHQTPDSGWICGWKLGAEPQAGVWYEVIMDTVNVCKIAQEGNEKVCWDQPLGHTEVMTSSEQGRRQ